MSYVRKLRPTVIHAHSPLLNGFPALWAGGRHRLPVVYEVRAFWEDAAVDQGTAKQDDLRYRTTRALETSLMRRADAVVTICDGLRQDIEARGIRGDKVTVVPNVVDSVRFASQYSCRFQLRERLQLDSEAFVLGFIGSFYHYEGLEFRFATPLQLLRSRPNLRLLLVGGGPAEIDCGPRSRSWALPIRYFAGRVPHRRLRRTMT